MRIGNLGCGCSIIPFIVVSVICLFASFLSGCQTTEWSVIHEGVLVKAEVSAGEHPYLNVSFEDGFSIPLYYGYFEWPIGWTTGTRYRLEERIFESSTRYHMVPVVPLQAEADGPDVQ